MSSNVEILTLKTFIDRDLKQFSEADNVRSIPSVIDGFKDAQRKAIHGALSHGDNKIKVAQLSGYCSLITHYEHGETSMASTIVNLAQSHAGSNNANLLEPIGQFGSILSDSSASPRYIFTKHSTNMKKYLHPDDMRLLKYKEDEDDKLEPEVYLPTLPMWVVNGALGIGTGHSVKILPRNPESVKSAVEYILANKEEIPSELLKPFFKGWKGTIEQGANDNQWLISGTFIRVNTTTIRITELPPTYSVDKYKSILIGLMDKGIIKDYDNNSDAESFNFIVTVPREVSKKTDKELISIFKLSIKWTDNITLWDENWALKKYSTIAEALSEFVQFKLNKVEERRLMMIADYQSECDWLLAKLKFIEGWNSNDWARLKKEQLKIAVVESLGEDVEGHLNKLLMMQINSLTLEKIAELQSDITAIQQKIIKLQSTNNKKIYKEDLAKL